MEESKLNGFERIIMALQHLFTMAPASMMVPLVMGNAIGLKVDEIAFLISANFFVNGIAIILQTLGIGSRIGSRQPIVFGASFAPLAPIILIGSQFGMQVVFGSIIASALVMYILSFSLERILKFFPPAVIGTFVTLIGISLAPIAMADLAGGEGSASYGSIENLVIGSIVLLIVLGLSSFGRGFIKSVSLLVGIIVGTIISFLVSGIDISSVVEASWIELVSPFKFGLPEFTLSSIFIMIIFSIVNTIQCVGSFSVYGEVTGDSMSDRQVSDSIRAQVLAQGVGGVFSAVPTTVFNENTGLMSITKVKDRGVILVTGVMLLFVGLIPKLSSTVTIIPKPVLGGATLALFGIILASGISILSRVDYSNRDNITVVGTSLSVGIGIHFTEGVFTQFPDTVAMLLGNGLFMASITAIALNTVLNGKKIGK